MEMTNFNNSELVELNSNELEETNGGMPWVVIILIAVAVEGVAEGILESYNRHH